MVESEFQSGFSISGSEQVKAVTPAEELFDEIKIGRIIFDTEQADTAAKRREWAM
jgi:hypothetical protein